MTDIMATLKNGETITIQLTIPITIIDEGCGWDLSSLKSWVENKCWEKLAESGSGEVEIGAREAKVINP